MKFVLLICALHLLLPAVSGFWDDGTSTVETGRWDRAPRQSFFRWPEAMCNWFWFFWPSRDWKTSRANRRSVVVAGISIDFICLGTATILNRRTLITAANLLDPFWDRQRDVRVWLLGNKGYYNTPYRYRVWRITRIFPKSLNPEHWHGPRGSHQPRHDIALIHSLDMMFVLHKVTTYAMYPFKSHLVSADKHRVLSEHIWFAGSGFEYSEHVRENYKIYWRYLNKANIVDCSRYLPKYWGKFICMVNVDNYYGVQNGMGMHNVIEEDDEHNPVEEHIVAIGAFEIRYNEERIMVWTDLRYYVDWITVLAYIEPGEYYEYAYPQWGIHYGFLWNSYTANEPRIPEWQTRNDLYPLG